MRSLKKILLSTALFIVGIIILGLIQVLAPNQILLKMIAVVVFLWSTGSVWLPGNADLTPSRPVFARLRGTLSRQRLIYGAAIIISLILITFSYSGHQRLRYSVIYSGGTPYRYDTWINKVEPIRGKIWSDSVLSNIYDFFVSKSTNKNKSGAAEKGQKAEVSTTAEASSSRPRYVFSDLEKLSDEELLKFANSDVNNTALNRKSEKKENTYRSEEHTFSIVFPAGWSIRSGRTLHGVVVAGNGKGASIIIQAWKLPEDKSYSQYHDADLKKIAEEIFDDFRKEQFKDAILENWGPTNLSGKKALKSVFRYTAGKYQMRTMMISVLGNKRMIQISCIAPVNSYNSVIDDFEATCGSFLFKTGRASEPARRFKFSLIIPLTQGYYET